MTRNTMHGLVLGLLAFGGFYVPRAIAVNPFVTLQYAADPSAHVFGDRIYVVASHDRTDAKEYDMTDHHVYSSDDLQNWQDHGPVLDIKDVPWAAPSHLWAPDLAFKDGVYYLCICPRGKPPSKDRPIGFATATSPAGPYTAMPQPLAGVAGIDPSVFIDDDGQPFIVWAGAGLQMAKLKSDFTAIDGKPFKVQGIEHFFEGPWLFKRDKLYYMTYAGVMQGGSGRGGNGQWFSYATSDTPTGPYTFRGDFSRTRGNDSNIHGSQVEFHGHWYCFYHDFSISAGQTKHGFKRGIRVDEIAFNPDGTLQDLKWTDTGPKQLKWLDPYRRCEAECLAQCDVPQGPHHLDTTPCPGGRALRLINDGDWARYAGVDFASGADSFAVHYAGGGCTIELHLDALNGPVVGRCALPTLNKIDEAWQTTSCSIAKTTGVHDLYLRCVDPSAGQNTQLDWWQFHQ